MGVAPTIALALEERLRPVRLLPILFFVACGEAYTGSWALKLCLIVTKIAIQQKNRYKCQQAAAQKSQSV
jgi:hypothetical protein